MTLLTTREVARMHNVTPARIHALAKARGVRPEVDHRAMMLWSPAQAAALKPGKPGRRPKSKTG